MNNSDVRIFRVPPHPTPSSDITRVAEACGRSPESLVGRAVQTRLRLAARTGGRDAARIRESAMALALSASHRGI
jgi:hypothetical protein